MISTINRTRGDSDIISSISPTINMMKIDANTGNKSKKSPNKLNPIIPDRIPNTTVNPPKMGIGTRCNFLASGLSTIFFTFATFKIYGCIQQVQAKAIRAGINIWNSSFLLIGEFYFRLATQF